MKPATIHRSLQKPWAGWPAPAALILLSLLPVIPGASRLTNMTGGQISPDNARFFASPIPVLIHIPAVTVYLLLGAFQFVHFAEVNKGKSGKARRPV
jgi:hypothetical protein